jgi:hypothetical protein
MRADWKAIRFAYHTEGEVMARELAETPCLDLSSTFDELRDNRSLISSYSWDDEIICQLPLCPVVVKMGVIAGRTGSGVPPFGLVADICEIRIDRMLENNSIENIDLLAMTDLGRPGAPNKKIRDFLLGLPESARAFSFRFYPELEKDDLSNIRSGHLLVRMPAFWYFTGAQQTLLLNAQKNDTQELWNDTVGRLWLLLWRIREQQKQIVLVDRVESYGLSAPHKTHERCQWTRDDLKEALAINLSEARAIGHPAGNGGTHASPIPHVRRGHYFTMRDGRYGDNIGQKRWRKQAWVGDTEWIFEGRQYRVVTDAKK